MSFFDSLKSGGWKRYIASLVTMVIPAVSAVPQLAPFATWLAGIAATFGAVGVAHAAASDNLQGLAPSNIASVIGILLMLAQQVPSLNWLIPILTALAGIFGGAAVAKGVVGTAK